MPGNPNKYTDEYRKETADYIISTGRPVAQVAKELGIHPKTAYRWVCDRKERLAGRSPKYAADPEISAMRKRIRELERENEFLKKAAAFFAKDQA